MIISIIFTIILIFSMILITIVNYDEFDTMYFIPMIYVIVYIIVFGFGMNNWSEKRTSIKCHQGNNPYNMEIRYELKDSTFVVKDTIYTLK